MPVGDLHKLNKGELERIDEQDSCNGVEEIASFANTFNDLLAKLQDSTKELEGLIYKLTTLSELTELVSRIPDIREVLKTVIQRALATVNARFGSIMLLDENDHCLRIAAAEGLDDSVIRNTVVKLGEGVAGRVAQTGESIVVEDVKKDPRVAESKISIHGSTSYICMALRVHERIIGVLNLYKDKKQNAFSETDLWFLKTLLSHISFAVENARLLEKVEAYMRLKSMEEVDQLKSDLLHLFCHETRTPLNGIIPPVKMVMEDEEMGHEERNEVLALALGAAERLQNLVEKSVTLSTMKAGKWDFKFESADLVEVIQRAIETVTPSADDLCLTIERKVPISEPSVFDQNEIEKVLVALLDNAIRFSPHGGMVTVRLLAVDNASIISVSDEGDGIDPVFLPNVFDGFSAVGENQKDNNHGLSLAMARQVVRAHGGKIDVESTPGLGSTFSLVVPCSPPGAENRATVAVGAEAR